MPARFLIGTTGWECATPAYTQSTDAYCTPQKIVHALGLTWTCNNPQAAVGLWVSSVDTVDTAFSVVDIFLPLEPV